MTIFFNVAQAIACNDVLSQQMDVLGPGNQIRK